MTEKTPCICISSGKGGVGKTSLSVNLACLLSRSGARVLLIDGDLGLANVDILLDLEVPRTLEDVLERDASMEEALAWVTPELAVLPASSGVPDMVNRDPESRLELQALLEELSWRFDLVIIDSAAGIGADVLWFNRISDLRVVVLTPDPTSVTDAYALMKVLHQDQDATRFALILNQVQDAEEARKLYRGLADVCDQYLGFRPEFLGEVVRDAAIRQALRSKKPLVLTDSRSPASQDLARLAVKLREATLELA